MATTFEKTTTIHSVQKKGTGWQVITDDDDLWCRDPELAAALALMVDKMAKLTIASIPRKDGSGSFHAVDGLEGFKPTKPRASGRPAPGGFGRRPMEPSERRSIELQRISQEAGGNVRLAWQLFPDKSPGMNARKAADLMHEQVIQATLEMWQGIFGVKRETPDTPPPEDQPY